MKRFILFFLPLAVSAQTWSWDTLYETISNEQFVRANDSSVYRLSSGASVLAKYSQSGVAQWTVDLGDGVRITSVAALNDTIFYVSGIFSNTISLAGTTLQCGGFSDIFYSRWKGTGQPEWIKQLGDDHEDFFSGITIHADTLYMTGEVSGSFFIGKFDLSGNLIAERTCSLVPTLYTNYPGLRGFECKVDQNGNVLVVGGIQGPVYFGSDTIQAPDEPFGRSVLLKFDPGLKLIWHFVEDEKYQYLHGLTVANSNDAYLIRQENYFGSGSNVEWTSILHLTPGNIWQDTFALKKRGTVHQIDVGNSGNVFFSAYQRPPDADYNYLTIGLLDPNLNPQWLFLDSAAGVRMGLGLAVLTPDRCLISGMFCDSLTLHTKLKTSSWPGAGFLALLSTKSVQSTSIPERVVGNNNLVIFPNPTDGAIHIDLPSAMHVRIMNILGQEVYGADLEVGPRTLDLSTLPTGTYFVAAGTRFSRVVKR